MAEVLDVSDPFPKKDVRYIGLIATESNGEKKFGLGYQAAQYCSVLPNRAPWGPRGTMV